jgi:hypothetical protein
LDTPGRNRSLAGDFFRGCCAAAPEKSSTSKLVFDPFGNIQDAEDAEKYKSGKMPADFGELSRVTATEPLYEFEFTCGL